LGQGSSTDVVGGTTLGSKSAIYTVAPRGTVPGCEVAWIIVAGDIGSGYGLHGSCFRVKVATVMIAETTAATVTKD
jgi:hypothetical protein